MKKLVLLASAGLLVAFAWFRQPGSVAPGDSLDANVAVAAQAPDAVLEDSPLTDAIRNRRSNVQVQGEGSVTRVLADDTNGSRHQRFILAIPSGDTLLVSHNIDLAPRVDALAVGDTVGFNGEYEWNQKGGVIHWTHRDPRGTHPHGWLKHKGVTYQ